MNQKNITCKFCGSSNVTVTSGPRIYCRDCRNRYRLKKDKSIFNDNKKLMTKTDTMETATELNIEITNSDRIMTLEELIKSRKIDLTKWKIKKFQCTQWESFYKKEGGTSHVVVPLYRVYASFEPITQTSTEVAIEGYINKLNMRAPQYTAKYIPKSNPCMLEISIFDHHFGKLAWGKETGHGDYDLKIAKDSYVKAVKDLLYKSQNFNLEKIILIIGQDFLNIDNEKNTTNFGTPQDTDSRLGKITTVALEAIHIAISEIIKVAPLKIIFVPGNHDRLITRFLCQILEAYYRNDNRIEFDIGFTQRKYLLYGNTLIGFTHGDEEKRDKLPLIMAGEVPELWAKSKFREIHTGHNHVKKSYHYNSGDSIVGVIVRILGSLTGVDEWHARKGYVNNNKIAEAFLYSKTEGPIGEFIYNEI